MLIRLREATTEINRATDDPRMKVIMEKTWLLQDRLVFTEMVSNDPHLDPCILSSYNCGSLMQGLRVSFEALDMSIFVVCSMFLGNPEKAWTGNI